MRPRILFVSKPIAPPYHDGTKCLVRDVATNLSRYDAEVMSTPSGPELGPAAARLRARAVYSGAGAFSPAVLDNARAATFLTLLSRADVWHFVFAPNPRTSTVGRWARRLRRVPVLQTVASPPRVFDAKDLFGDRIVVQSRWTERRVLAAAEESGVPIGPVDVIPPPVAELAPRRDEDVRSLARSLELPEGAPIFIYPGDIDQSHGAEEVARVVEPLCRRLPDAVVVFACRAKTPRAPLIERDYRRRLPARHVRFVGANYDLPTLLLACDVVLFPVDDLYGKVDLPISLLEAMQLGVPVVAPEQGPLADLASVERGPLGSPDVLADVAARLALDEGYRKHVVDRQREEVTARFAAARVAEAYEALYDRLLGR